MAHLSNDDMVHITLKEIKNPVSLFAAQAESRFTKPKESRQASQPYPVPNPLGAYSITVCYASAGFVRYLSAFLQYMKKLGKNKS